MPGIRPGPAVGRENLESDGTDEFAAEDLDEAWGVVEVKRVASETLRGVVLIAIAGRSSSGFLLPWEEIGKRKNEVNGL